MPLFSICLNYIYYYHANIYPMVVFKKKIFIIIYLFSKQIDLVCHW